VAAWWEGFWFRPADDLGLIVTRTVSAATALWLVLSRPDLPSLSAWPRELWSGVGPALAARYLIGAPPWAEWAAFVLLHVALIAVLAGAWSRVAAFVSALLLYHFASFEEVLWHSVGPYFRGFTLPLLGLFVVSFAPVPRRGVRSSDHRWPVALVQVFVVLHYLLPAWAKLTTHGLDWASGAVVRDAIVATATAMDQVPPAAYRVAASPFLCGLIGVLTLGMELLSPLALVSRPAAIVLVALAVVGHVGIAATMGAVFLALPMLVVLLPWERA
jgi:hypothetical protein